MNNLGWPVKTNNSAPSLLSFGVTKNIYKEVRNRNKGYKIYWDN